MKVLFYPPRKQGLLCLSFLLAMFCSLSRLQAQSTVIISPTVNDGDFENASSSWTIVNGSQTNKWYISTNATAGFNGAKCAYISNSASAPYAHDYDQDVSSVVQFYQDVTLPAGEPNVTLSFKVVCEGEAAGTNLYDYLRVYLAPTTVAPAAGTQVNASYQVGNTYYLLGTSWTTLNITIPASLAGNATAATTRRLIFQWRNDGSDGSNPPAGIDSVTLITTCAGPAVTAGATAVTTTGATLNWATYPGATGYQVRYKKVSDPATVATWATPTVVTGGGTTSLPVTGLSANQVQYEYQVLASNCPTWSSSALFSTLCVPYTPPYLETFESIAADNQLPACMSATNLGNQVLTYTAATGDYNRINHTPGGAKFASFKWSSNDWIFTPQFNLVAGQTYQLRFYYITDGYTGWNSLKAAYGTSATAGAMTNIIGAPVPLPSNTTYQVFQEVFTPTVSGTYNVGINVEASSNPFYLSVDDISVVPVSACAGVPNAGALVQTGPVNTCAGKTFILEDTGSTQALGISYQWVRSLDHGATWTAATGGSGLIYTTPPLSDTVWYSMVAVCGNTNQRDTTAPLVFNVVPPQYATLPFTESFESWTNRCGTTDVPSVYWTADPTTGDNAWRRQDQGASANWGAVGSYLYSPAFFEGSYSARFHSGSADEGYLGRMDLYLNCGPTGGALETRFRYINIDGTDSLKVYLSTDNGTSFTLLNYFTTASIWTEAVVPFTSNSPQTILRFVGVADFGSTDIGLDYVRVLPPCTGTPVAGTIPAIGTVCANASFTLTLNGTSPVAGLSYQWQSSPDGNTWTNIAGATTPGLTTSIVNATYFRVVVTCTASGSSAVSNTLKVELSSFLICYCTPTYGNGGANDRINIVQLGVMSNNSTAAGNPSPYYVDYAPQQPANIPVPALYRGQIDTVRVTFGSDGSQYGSVWIDFNRNGVFEATEHFSNNTQYAGNATAKIPVTVPVNASIGLTKMRVRGGDDNQPDPTQPCGASNSSFGEAEDYLVDLRYPPCSGQASAGTAESSDASLCVGYELVLTDTTHAKELDGLSWTWQSSTNGTNWNNVTGSDGQDQITMPMTGAVQYRLRMVCQNSNDTTYSNAVSVTVPNPWQCYCYSTATGKAQDTTDFGAFRVGSYVFNTGGPHLSNNKAVRARTDNTNITGIVLYADSTYNIDLYQIMRNHYHGDARVTMFIDFNNNLVYDIPEDRVLSTATTPNDWYLLRSVTLPSLLTPDVPTGMRVIINSNTAPNTPSDDACGGYTSGETEDYVVTLRKAFPSDVPHTGLLRDLSLYPNPTEGRFTVQLYSAEQVRDLEVTVTNLTGQQVLRQAYRQPSRQFRAEMDLSSQPRGVYLVEVHADGDKAVRKLIVR